MLFKNKKVFKHPKEVGKKLKEALVNKMEDKLKHNKL
jgi:hypothetical protein